MRALGQSAYKARARQHDRTQAMAAKLGAHLGNDDDLAIQHEINVTPFIDVILVLLIIFMVAAPLATVDVRRRPAGVDGAAAAASRTQPVYRHGEGRSVVHAEATRR
jgi:biopolymer transport protein ExbD